ncbi:proprotein convertase subtilisin/kexin type 4 [Willisornis vidua]|uniref:Proprotein convertase subtilisin/kexin type 4 n=1 Tax=Willisornis vidua TaxID=1566151 RepID=A0ABQ9CZH4_9PASS|nr:proprotein convertase subtilisin/kexin type 4 [Willisornis vidua]
MRLMRDPQVLWFEQQTLKRHTKRSASVVPTDPWFPKQWYMNNDISPDLNILTAWSRGYTGLGVVLTILDDGLEKDHPDLAANYLEKSSKITKSTLCPMPTLSLSATSRGSLGTSRDGNSTTSLGSPFQCLAILSTENFLLLSNLNLPWCNLLLFPPLLSLFPGAEPNPRPPGRELQRDPQASYDFNSNDPDPQPRYGDGDKNWHGTRCAGEVAAVANNGICGAGVAYNAKIGGVRMLDGPITDVVEAQALSLHSQHIHIYSASWGPEDNGKTVDGPGELAAAAFQRGVSQGRGGLGSIFIWASGNGGIHYDNCNCDGYSNSIYTVSVGSVLGDGQRPHYSEGCAAILTTTYSSRTSSEVQIVTTDLHHRCTDKHTGTSASAPLAAGMVALALEANPALTWRDLQHLIIRASKPAHLQSEDWAKNGVGRRVSHYYGYGLLDAGLLVQEAAAWLGTQPQEKCSVKVLQAPRDIGSKLAVSTDVFSCSQRIRSLEHVQVQLSLSYTRRGDLLVALSSPMGTTSTLVTVRPYDTSQEGYKDWTFMSTHFWDENPKGTWTLHLENRGSAHNTGKLTNFILHLHGTNEDMISRHSAASATDACLRWDEQGACEECGSSLYAHQRSCLPYCPPRYYGRTQSATATDTARVCARCHPSCYTCQGASANNCTSCPSTRSFQKLSHTCSPQQGPLSPGVLRRYLLVVTVLVCSTLVLAGVLYPTYRVAFRAGKGTSCCPQAGRTE